MEAEGTFAAPPEEALEAAMELEEEEKEKEEEGGNWGAGPVGEPVQLAQSPEVAGKISNFSILFALPGLPISLGELEISRFNS